jgi:hypothetical protein
MRLAIAITTACAFGAGMIGAQQDAEPEERRAHNVYVLQGCLAAAAPDAIGQYVLTDASAEDGAPPGAQPGDRGETNYLLRAVGITESGVDDDELRVHVGFPVEVTVRPPDLPPPGRGPDDDDGR